MKKYLIPSVEVKDLEFDALMLTQSIEIGGATDVADENVGQLASEQGWDASAWQD